MSEPGQSTQAHSEAPVDAVKAGKKSLPRRLGCWLLLVFWFALLLTPCGLFYLAANGEIRLEHGQVPDAHAHPRLLIALISESDDRGLRIESSTIKTADEDSMLCVETVVTFLLWESSGGNQNVHFCDCYRRLDEASSWDLISTHGAACGDAS